jgi:2-phosphosulfolactate phosphatase
MGIFDQAEFEVRFEWGLAGLQSLAPISDTVIIVDVLSFTTCVSIAVDRGAAVFPYDPRDESAAEFARTLDAHLGVPRRHTSPEHPYSLSPKSMLEVTEGTHIVLPSPNGSSLSFTAQDAHDAVLAGCLRNAQAIGEAASNHGRTTAVIAAGERWEQGDSLRPAVEDLVGAGAIIRMIPGSKSPESQTAVAAFESIGNRITEFLMQTSSGKELRSLGYEVDVALSSELDVTSTVPVLKERAYIRMKG